MVSKAKYSEEDHLLYMYLEGDTEVRVDIILTHPDVIGLTYTHNDTVVKVYLPKKVVDFKASTKDK